MSNQQQQQPIKRNCAFESYRITSEAGNITQKALTAFELWINNMTEPNVSLIITLTANADEDLLSCWKNGNEPYSEDSPRFALQKFDPTQNTGFFSEGAISKTITSVEGAMENTRHLERLFDLVDIIRKYPQHSFLLQTFGYLTPVATKTGNDVFYQMPGVRTLAEKYIESRYEELHTGKTPPKGFQITFEHAVPNLFFTVHVSNSRQFRGIAEAFRYDYHKRIDHRGRETSNWEWVRKNLNVRKCFYLKFDERWNLRNKMNWEGLAYSWAIVDPIDYPKTGLREIRKFCKMLLGENIGTYINHMSKAWQKAEIKKIQQEIDTVDAWYSDVDPAEKLKDKDYQQQVFDLLNRIGQIEKSEDAIIPDALAPYRMFPSVGLTIQHEWEMPNEYRDKWLKDELRLRFQRYLSQEPNEQEEGQPIEAASV